MGTQLGKCACTTVEYQLTSLSQWYCTPNTGIINFQVDPAQAQGSMEIHEEDEDDEDSELDDDNDSM
jgi:hypothetical protein